MTPDEQIAAAAALDNASVFDNRGRHRATDQIVGVGTSIAIAGTRSQTGHHAP